jgi:hypothetical protein
MTLNWEKAQPATGKHGDPDPYVCAAGYLHEFEDGRVECPLCGRGAYTRSKTALVNWETAHQIVCKRRAAIAASA